MVTDDEKDKHSKSKQRKLSQSRVTPHKKPMRSLKEKPKNSDLLFQTIQPKDLAQLELILVDNQKFHSRTKYNQLFGQAQTTNTLMVAKSPEPDIARLFFVNSKRAMSPTNYGTETLEPQKQHDKLKLRKIKLEELNTFDPRQLIDKIDPIAFTKAI